MTPLRARRGGSHISLFSGVGMTDLAAEKAGFKTVATAEVDPFCRSVLRRRFPDALHYSDVRDMRVLDDALRHASRQPLLVSGGFPCQDISVVGRGVGITGARSGLWSEMARVIREFRPDYVLSENSPALRHRGLHVVLDDFNRLGYDVRWDCIPAAAVGAPHLRDRIYIVAVKRGALKCSGKKIADAPLDLTRFPRAGRMLSGAVYEDAPLALIREAKKANLFRELLPTPVASDDGKSPEAHLAMKARLGGGARRQITSLSVLARAGFPEDRGRAMSKALFPTAADAEDRSKVKAGAGRPWYGPYYPTPRAAPNEWRTTRNAPSHGNGHGKTLAGEVNDRERAAGRTPAPPSDSAGNLNPQWVEWLMGLPLGWTDQALSNGALMAHPGWHEEPAGVPRTITAPTNRKARLKALGNGLVPQAAEIALGWLELSDG